MALNFGFCIGLYDTHISELNDVSKILSVHSSQYICLRGMQEKIQSSIPEANTIIKKSGLLILVEFEELISAGLTAHGLIVEFKDIPKKKKDYPNLLVGGYANDVAGAKNIELYGGDFVFLGPLNKIGELPYTTLIPKKPDYEWRFLDITIPVVGFGFTTKKELEVLCEKANLSGFLGSIDDFKNIQKADLRFISI